MLYSTQTITIAYSHKLCNCRPDYTNALRSVLLLMKVTKDMIIADVLKKHVSAKTVFAKYLPACVTCGGATAETIERGARMHGVNPQIIVDELNGVAKKRRASDG